MSSIIFITFDIKKDEYPSMPYSVAAMIASLKKEKQKTSHLSIDLEHALRETKPESSITDIITQGLMKNKNYFCSFNFVAISLTAWTIDYCKVLLGFLNDYNGKVILGGYEVTSMNDAALINTFPRADYFIKGYAETALKRLLVDGYMPESKVISIDARSEDLVSPYLSGVLNTYSKKLYWETKRGCPYNCGFCEWGNAIKNVFEIDKERLLQEIEMFEDSSISEINILDGTFNWGDNYLFLFERLLEISGLRITCQVRFEALLRGRGLDFLELCKAHRDRVHLEFGLQTIHISEMQTIGRNNNLENIVFVLDQLNGNNIDYEVSVIYAIPGQTVESLIETIEFLITNGCKNIKAYPLRIPKNSKLEDKRESLKVKETFNELNVSSVVSSHSFSEEHRRDMDNIIERINKGELYRKPETFEFEDATKQMKLQKKTESLWEIASINNQFIDNSLINRVLVDFYSLTLSEIYDEDFRQGYLWTSRLQSINQNLNKSISDAISKQLYMEIEKWEIEQNVDDPYLKQALATINPNVQPKKYFCKAYISKNGNYYISREIIHPASYLTMKKIITITGDLGSGKSSVGKLLKKKLQWELINIGEIQRFIAADLKMGVMELNQYMETHPDVDTMLDEKIQEIGKTHVNMILDSRIAWYWIPDSFKIFLKVDPNEAARRVFNEKRESEKYLTLDEARIGIERRKEMERARLKTLYSIDICDMRNYDLIIDTTSLSPQEVCNKILKRMNFE